MKRIARLAAPRDPRDYGGLLYDVVISAVDAADEILDRIEHVDGEPSRECQLAHLVAVTVREGDVREYPGGGAEP
eukprot:CAMPEP_0119494452 /NCGR_PEP_ID=MMETSP1344-20130328/18397_1 /TAXON_ID=236787 /ORGANISM="Florenciella parvula, Strain CCMP2471" /LENGTH=74 /DNA_ID=CAMNT_0007529955 /DNA_START=114 /DNA_END=338 /DNA_ORIENTATION=+